MVSSEWWYYCERNTCTFSESFLSLASHKLTWLNPCEQQQPQQHFNCRGSFWFGLCELILVSLWLLWTYMIVKLLFFFICVESVAILNLGNWYVVVVVVVHMGCEQNCCCCLYRLRIVNLCVFWTYVIVLLVQYKTVFRTDDVTVRQVVKTLNPIRLDNYVPVSRLNIRH